MTAERKEDLAIKIEAAKLQTEMDVKTKATSKKVEDVKSTATAKATKKSSPKTTKKIVGALDVQREEITKITEIE